MKGCSIISFSVFVVVLFGFVFTGCTASTETKLQEIVLEGVPIRQPIRITENREKGNLNLRANVSFNNKNELATKGEEHSMVNELGFFQVEEVDGQNYFLEQAGINTNNFEGNNLIWNIPNMQAQFEIDYAASKHFAIIAGVNYSEVRERSFFGQSLGFAFFGEKKNWGYRFDANVNFYQMDLTANYVVIEQTDYPKKVIFISEKKTNDWKDINFGGTLNTNRRDWLINVFFNYSFGWHTLYNFESNAVKSYAFDFPFLYPREEREDFEFFESYSSFSIGIYKNVFDVCRIVFGARYTKYGDNKGRLSTPDFFFQYDFIL